MRLTNTVKDHIVSMAIQKAGIAEAFEKLIKARAEWAEKARIKGLVIPEEEIEAKLQAMRDIANTLPQGCISTRIEGYTSYYAYVNVAGQSHNAFFSGAFNSTTSPIRKLTNGNGVTYKAGDPMAIEWEKLLQEGKDLSLKKHSIRIEVLAALNSVNTIKQLLDVWPEAIELLPPNPVKTKSTLPAVQVDTLNKTIGLPTK